MNSKILLICFLLVLTVALFAEANPRRNRNRGRLTSNRRTSSRNSYRNRYDKDDAYDEDEEEDEEREDRRSPNRRRGTTENRRRGTTRTRRTRTRQSTRKSSKPSGRLNTCRNVRFPSRPATSKALREKPSYPFYAVENYISEKGDCDFYIPRDGSAFELGDMDEAARRFCEVNPPESELRLCRMSSSSARKVSLNGKDRKFRSSDEMDFDGIDLTDLKYQDRCYRCPNIAKMEKIMAKRGFKTQPKMEEEPVMKCAEAPKVEAKIVDDNEVQIEILSAEPEPRDYEVEEAEITVNRPEVEGYDKK